MEHKAGVCRENRLVRIEFQTEDMIEKQRNALFAKRYQTRRRVGKMELRIYHSNKNVNAQYTISRDWNIFFLQSTISMFTAQFDNKVPFLYSNLI